MFKLNIIRKALNSGHDLYLAKSSEEYGIFHPDNPILAENSLSYRNDIVSGKIEIIGKIKSEGGLYNILNKNPYNGSYAGLGGFCGTVGQAYADTGFLGCATKEIAEHFGKYFGMLITKAKYGDLLDFEIVENKYQN